MPRCKKPMYTYAYTNWDQVPLFLSVSETCVLLKVSEQTVRNRLKDGTFRGIMMGKTFLVEKESIIDLLCGRNVV